MTFGKSALLPEIRSKLNDIISSGTSSSMPNGIKISAVLSAAPPGKPRDHEVVCLDSDDDGIQVKLYRITNSLRKLSNQMKCNKFVTIPILETILLIKI